MRQITRHYYEFGPYRLETNERILLREGQHVPLTPKAFETLLALVESGGHILDKEDLLKKVWPDTIVEEVSLAKKVSILRKVLGEDVEHHYIETIPRRGYRFVADVREVWQEDTAIVEPRAANGTEIEHETTESELNEGLEPAHPSIAPNSAGSIRRALSGRPLGMVGGFSFSRPTRLGLGVWQWAFRPATNASKSALNAIPLTSYQGRETQMAFSPDGNQIAFVWNGPQGDNQDIYVKLIDAETPLRLTTNPAEDINPVWSPDGRHIAFLRQSAEGSEFYLIPTLGGAERKLAKIFPYQVPSDGNSHYYSPRRKIPGHSR